MSEHLPSQNPNSVIVANVEFYEKPDLFPQQDVDQIGRFIITDEPYVADAFNFVKDRLSKESIAEPALVGAVAFGSATKGYALPFKSDLDLTVFVDTDVLKLPLLPVVNPGDVSWNAWSAYKNSSNQEVKEYYTKYYAAALTPDMNNGLALTINANVKLPHSATPCLDLSC